MLLQMFLRYMEDILPQIRSSILFSVTQFNFHTPAAYTTIIEWQNPYSWKDL